MILLLTVIIGTSCFIFDSTLRSFPLTSETDFMDIVILFLSDMRTVTRINFFAKVRNFTSQGNGLSTRLFNSLHLARINAVENLCR